MLGLALLLAVPLAQGADEAQRLLKEEIDRRAQERRERRWDESHHPGVLTPPPAMPATPPGHAGPCFPIRHITLHPDGLLAPRRVSAVLAHYQGRCLSAADLAALQQALNAQALAQGLVTTRVTVPEQNLAGGELRLEVWPGQLEALQAPGLARSELALARALAPGDLLQLRALEQTVDNLNRLASLRASIALLPGATPGGSVARIDVQRARPWQAALAWLGEAMNGEETHTVRGSVVIDSPLRIADRLILGVNGSLQDGQVDDAHGGSVDYGLVWGWWQFSVGADRFDYENPVHTGLTPFTASGESRAWRAEALRQLHRDARNRWSLALHAKQRLSDNFIDGVTIGVSSTRVRAIGLRLDFSHVAAPWVWDASLDIDNGQGRTPARLSPLDADYLRLLGHTRLQYYFGNASLLARLSGQWSDARLAPSEQFSLTGTVPGFSPLGLHANTGAALQLELAHPLALPATALPTLRPSLGLAWALAPHGGGNPARERLTAATAGLALPWRHALASLALAHPIEKLNSVNAPQGWQLDAGLSLQW